MLFQSYLEQPTSDEVRGSYLSAALVEGKEDESLQQLNSLNNIGYSDEQIKKIKDQLAKAGLL